MAITLRKMKEKLDQFNSEIIELQRKVKGFEVVIAYYEAQGEGNEQPTIPIQDTIERILMKEGQPLHYATIYEHLQAEGILVGGKEPSKNVLAHMSGDKARRFEPLGKGVWRLKTWAAKEPDLPLSFQGSLEHSASQAA